MNSKVEIKLRGKGWKHLATAAALVGLLGLSGAVASVEGPSMTAPSVNMQCGESRSPDRNGPADFGTENPER